MTAAGTYLVLDRDVRDWVLIPLTFSVILMMLLRQYATQARRGSAAGCTQNAGQWRSSKPEGSFLRPTETLWASSCFKTG
mgnify:CR=1 FL=1